MVSAGTEHERFINLFPFWEVSKAVQELNCKVRLISIPIKVQLGYIKSIMFSSYGIGCYQGRAQES